MLDYWIILKIMRFISCFIFYFSLFVWKGIEIWFLARETLKMRLYKVVQLLLVIRSMPHLKTLSWYRIFIVYCNCSKCIQLNLKKVQEQSAHTTPACTLTCRSTSTCIFFFFKLFKNWSSGTYYSFMNTSTKSPC